MKRSIVEIMEEAVEGIKNQAREPVVYLCGPELYKQMALLGYDMIHYKCHESPVFPSEPKLQVFSAGPRDRWGRAR